MLPKDIDVPIAAVVYVWALETVNSQKIALLVTLGYVQQLFKYDREQAWHVVRRATSITNEIRSARPVDMTELLKPSTN